MKSRKIKLKKILIIDGVILVIILSMFIFVRCRHRDAFTDKGYYKNISLKGTWFKVDLDEMYQVKFYGADYEEQDVYGEQARKGKYEIGNHALKLGSKQYSMKYVNERKELEDMIDDDIEQYELKEYFYIIDDEGNKIYYFKQEEDAADQLDYNCQTNAYYEKSGMFDQNGFAIDEEGMLLAYNGDKQQVTVPESVSGIAENAFSADYNRALNTEKVIIPGSVKKIESGAFLFSNVDIVVINEGVEEIQDWAFGDSHIKEIYLPKQILHMSPKMFETEEGVEGLKIYCPAGSQTELVIKNNPPAGDYELIKE